jgi:hypothetical protein
VASRIIQRIDELRRRNPRIGILHLMRTPNSAGHRFGQAQRKVYNIDTYQLPLNPLKRLQVANDFELRELRNGPGRIYAAGTCTFGGPYAAVDSFLGLQYAAQRSVETLAALQAPGLRRLHSARSVVQWLKWSQGVQP